MDSLFTWDADKVIISPEALTIYEYKRLWDMDGTKTKEIAYKYFVYLWHRCSRKAVPIRDGYTDQRAHEYACKIAMLQPGFNIGVIASTIDKAMARYISTNHTTTTRLFDNLVRSLSKSVEITDKIDAILNSKVSIINPSADDDTLKAIKEVIVLQQEVFNIADKIPKYLDLLVKYKETIDAESKVNVKLARGKVEITSSMDGDNDIEG